jgi:hypothetical protein
MGYLTARKQHDRERHGNEPVRRSLALCESLDSPHIPSIGSDPVKRRRILETDLTHRLRGAIVSHFTGHAQLILMSRPYRGVMQRDEATESRLGRARHRAARAKLGLVAASVVIFAAGVAATRATVAGHARRPARPLAAPPRFVRTVRHDALQAGILAPPAASPGVATAQS